ncbi:MAG: hypothetical protein NC401_15450 [Ruminococcus sp.]|nr:hypothetical protein [Ruminococcus sp.]
MKKMLSFLTAIMTALSLCACDKADDVSGSVPESGSGSTVSSTTLGESGGSSSEDAPTVPVNSAESTELRMLTDPMQIHFDGAACAADEGLYYVEPGRIGKSSAYLMYIDYATAQETYLCSDSSCKHDSERCSSALYFEDFFLGNSAKMFVYGDFLYYLSIDYDHDGGTSSRAPSEPEKEQALYRMRLDGSNRERVFVFEEDITVVPFAAGDGSALWFYVKTPVLHYSEKSGMFWTGCTDRAMIRLDLESRTVVERIPLGNSDSIYRMNILGCCGNKFIFKTWEYPEGVTMEEVYEMKLATNDPAVAPPDRVQDPRLDEIEENIQSIYYALDPVNKECREIFRCNWRSDYVRNGFYGDDMYLFELGSSVTVVNVNGGGVSDYEQLIPVPGYRLTGFIGIRGGTYLCASLDPDDNAVYFVDPDTGAVTCTRLRSTLYPDYDVPLTDDIAGISGEYVLVRSGEIAIPNNHGGIAGYYYQYKVATVDDFLNGADNFTDVKLIER